MTMPTVTLHGLPVPCWLQAGDRTFALSGVLSCQGSLVLQAGFHPLPLDRLVIVHAGERAWAGWLDDEQVWEDGTLTYTLRL
jgi:hypothetical protein